MDVADIGAQRASQFTDASIDRVRKASKQKLAPRGECLYCGEPCPGVFCNPQEHDCRDEWEREQRRLQQLGRA